MTAVLELNQLELTKSEVLYGVSWEDYEKFLNSKEENQYPRFFYNNGILEISMPKAKHENINYVIEKLATYIAEELEIDVIGVGALICKREDLAKGCEPDSCFYIQSASLISDIDDIDLEKDPPPDLVIEIDITSSSVSRLPIFAELGVSEVWRFDGEKMQFLKLVQKSYVETNRSISFPILTSETATDFLRARKNLGSTAWAKKVREFVAENRVQE